MIMTPELDYPLLRPVDHGGVLYEVLRLEEPTAGQLIEAEKEPTDMGRLARLISLVAKVPHGVALQIRRRDLQAIDDFFGAFSLPDQPAAQPQSAGS